MYENGQVDLPLDTDSSTVHMSHFKLNLKQCDVVAFFVPLNNSTAPNIQVFTLIMSEKRSRCHHITPREIFLSGYELFCQATHSFFQLGVGSWMFGFTQRGAVAAGCCCHRFYRMQWSHWSLVGKRRFYLTLTLACLLRNDKINQSALVFKLANLFNQTRVWAESLVWKSGVMRQVLFQFRVFGTGKDLQVLVYQLVWLWQ